MSGTNHLLVDLASIRRLRPTAEFATEADRDAYRYTKDDVGKVVKVLSPLNYWLIVSVTRHVATFRELAADLVNVEASEVQNDSSVEGVSVKDALDTLVGLAFGGQVKSVFGRTGTVTAQAGDYSAAQVGAPPVARAINAGAGLTGGGDLTADRTLAADFGSAAGKVCEGNDPRLSDPRTPAMHALSHLPGGPDGLASGPASALIVGGSNAEGTAMAFARQDHLHALPPFGSASGTFCEGSDPRLSDARMPMMHALSHAPGGPDGLQVGTAVAIGTANAEGTAAAYARADHVHDGSALVPRDGSRPMTGALDAGGFNLTNIGAVFEAPTSFAWVANAATIDVSAKNDFVASDMLTGNSTLTLSNGVDGCQGTVYVKQDAAGGRSLTFVVPGRVILREAGAMDSNPQQGANSVTGYAYDFKTIGGTAYVIVERFFLT